MNTRKILYGKIGRVRVGGFRGRPCVFFGLTETVLRLDRLDSPQHDEKWQQCSCAVPALIDALKHAEGRFAAVSGFERVNRSGHPILIIDHRGRVDFLDPVDFVTTPAER